VTAAGVASPGDRSAVSYCFGSVESLAAWKVESEEKPISCMYDHCSGNQLVQVHLRKRLWNQLMLLFEIRAHSSTNSLCSLVDTGTKHSWGAALVRSSYRFTVKSMLPAVEAHISNGAYTIVRSHGGMNAWYISRIINHECYVLGTWQSNQALPSAQQSVEPDCCSEKLLLFRHLLLYRGNTAESTRWNGP
jgi:hypothetical protein